MHRESPTSGASRRVAWTSSLALVLVAALAATASGAVVRDRLPNGIRVVVEPSSWNRVVSVSVLVDAGSRYDPPGRRGLASITNDLLEYSTASRSTEEICALARCDWIDFGTTITEDFAEVYAVVVDDRFGDAIALVAEAVSEPAFAGAELAKLQVAALREVDSALDDPFERTYAKLNELLFRGHPYAFPVRGTGDGIARITRSDVSAFHAERYVGGAIVVSIVGNVDADEALEAVREHFGGIPAAAPPAGDFAEVTRTATEAFELFKDVEQGRVQIGFLAPPSDSPDYAAVRVLSEVLGGGSGSRLYAALSGEGAGVADVVGAFYPLRIEAGRLVIYATVSSVDAAVAMMSAEVERLRAEPLDEQELDRAKNRIAGQYAIRAQRNIERARRLAWDELSGMGPGAHDRLVAAVRNVRAEEVRAAAERYLVEPTLVILRPGRTGKGGGI